MPRTTKSKTKKDRISTFADWLTAQPLLTELTFTALTVLFGMQALRVLVPGMFWTLSDRMGWSPMELGALAFLIFLTAFLAHPLSRLIGNYRLLVATAGGVGLARLFMQVWWGEPLFNLALAIAGTILFIIFLPTCLERARLQGNPAVSRFGLGLLGGLVLDVAINGAFSTYDTAWQMEPLPVLITLLLVVVQLVLLVGITPLGKAALTASASAVRTSFWRSLAWLAIGPFLFLELVVFQNIPRLATLTDWPLPIAFGITLLAQMAGLAAATWLLSKTQRSLWSWALGFSIVLVAVLVFEHQESAAITALLLLVGQVLISALLAVVLVGVVTGARKTEHFGFSVANGVGMVLLLIFIFAYYAVYDISLPYKNTLLEPIAGTIIAVCAIGTSVTMRQEIKVNYKLWAVPVLALVLLLLPIGTVAASRAPVAATGKGFPITIMTYNLHNGFDTKGKLDIEAIAQVIEQSNPDIVALQEVSRGFVVSGRLDMLEWLSQRLCMPYVFGPTADPLWGNAILSHYPILAYSRHDLPPRDLPILRGFIAALIDVGNNEKLRVIATHFHHINEDTEIRQLQSKSILQFLEDIGSERTVLLGDLNAGPSEQEILMLGQAGLVDTGERMLPHIAYTYASDDPYQRIDYIWISPDLQTWDIRIPLSTASDHLPVVVIIGE